MYTNNLKKAREINRALIRKMHAICAKYHITYFCDSGFLLGAVRDHSFIPWDDDVDIAFTREEYNKLIHVPKEEWGDDFLLVPYRKLADGHFLDYTTRLVYLKDTVPQRTYEKVNRNCNPQIADKMCMDCFVIDNAFDKRWKQRILTLRLMVLYGMSMGYREYIDYSEYHLLQRIVVFLLASVGKCFPLDRIFDEFDKVSMSGKKNSSKVFYSTYSAEYLTLTYERAWFSKTVPLQVDDDLFNGPVGYDCILRNLYGNYMTLPPEEQRIPLHVLPDER